MKVTVWLDYGYEGWQPNDFDSDAEAVEFIKGGRTYGSRFRITRECDLQVEAPPPLPFASPTLVASLNKALTGLGEMTPEEINEAVEFQRRANEMMRKALLDPLFPPPAKEEPK